MMRTRENEEAWFDWRRWLADERAAWRWLTVVPVPGSEGGGGDAAVFPRCLRAFPLVGAMIGALGAAVLLITHWATGAASLSALSATFAIILLTGAMHEDGVADFADAMGGGDPRRRLAIMRDPNIGAFGVLALIAVVGANVLALTEILHARGTAAAQVALFATHGASRSAAVWILHALPPARSEGLSRTTGRPNGRILRQTLAVTGLVALLPLLVGFGPRRTLLALLLTVLAVAGIAAWARRTLGGQTGDVAGAAECVARAVLLVALS